MRGEQMLSCLQQGAGGVRRVPILLYPGHVDGFQRNVHGTAPGKSPSVV